MNLEMTVFAAIDAISVSEASNKNSVKLYIACLGKVLVYTQQHTSHTARDTNVLPY